ncbi:MAG: hypothetical protein KDA65_06650 [Planctomycetaceae bacterium]|nr:hypothetical protein [Planctomycetaceae bacterium]
MTYSFPADSREHVQAVKQSGAYETVDDLLREAITTFAQAQQTGFVPTTSPSSRPCFVKAERG